MAGTEVTSVATPHGEARLHRDAAARPVARLVLGHGAGGGVESPDLVALAAALPSQGVTVVRLEQPWRVAGRKIATPPPTLDAGLRAAVDALAPADRAVPLVVGGRSAGARSAARCAGDLGAAGAVLLSFPLHPPGRPERSRAGELAGLLATGTPTLVVQGERDTMGTADELVAALADPAVAPAGAAGADLAVVPHADHGLKVPKRAPLGQDEALALVVEAVLEWVVRDVVG
ncbi:alpha/beta family hydrolase [Nocardioides sp. CPCC 205120]|uniref:alpha/beta hydrolase family protein n=1 Tax=Nocardioides sp. CPCC 205120 TaxID=3406462 RepID=UPI003B500265